MVAQNLHNVRLAVAASSGSGTFRKITPAFSVSGPSSLEGPPQVVLLLSSLVVESPVRIPYHETWKQMLASCCLVIGSS